MTAYVIFYPVRVTGHVAIILDGLKKKNKYGSNNIHISFYHEIKQSPASTFFRLHGIQVDGEDVTQIIQIPTQETHGKGLSEADIYQWFVEEFKKPKMYGLLDQNCSSIVYKALMQGQLAAISLGNKLEIEKNWNWLQQQWFCTPINILNYAIKLSKYFVQNLYKTPSVVEELIDIIKVFKREPVIGTDKWFAIYFKILKFPAVNDRIMLEKPFCKASLKGLKKFHTLIDEMDLTPELKNSLAFFTATSPEPAIDINHFYEKFNGLKNFIDGLEANDALPLNKAFNKIIEKDLLPYLYRSFDALYACNITDPQQIKTLITHLKNKVDDELNPHKNAIQAGTKSDIPYLFPRLRGY